MKELIEGESPSEPHWCKPKLGEWVLKMWPRGRVPIEGDRWQDRGHEQQWVNALKTKTLEDWDVHLCMWTTFKRLGIDPFEVWPMPTLAELRRRK